MKKTILTKIAIATLATTVMAGAAFAETTVKTINNSADASTVSFGEGLVNPCSTLTNYDNWTTQHGSPQGVTDAGDTTVASLGAASGIGICLPKIGGCNVTFYSDEHCGTAIDHGKVTYSDGNITVTQAPTSGHVTISGSGTDSLTMTIQ